MDKTTAQKLKEALLNEKANIESQLGEIAKKNPAIKGDWTAVPQDIGDPAESMDEKAQIVTNLEERRAVEQSLELRLKEIEQTLENLARGTYGVCVNCKLPIDTKRLQAMPAVRHCFDCASKTTLT